jgi:hypothetical protein
MNAMVTSEAPPHLLSPRLAAEPLSSNCGPLPLGGEGTAHGPLSLGRERAGVRVRRQFANYSGQAVSAALVLVPSPTALGGYAVLRVDPTVVA